MFNSGFLSRFKQKAKQSIKYLDRNQKKSYFYKNLLLYGIATALFKLFFVKYRFLPTAPRPVGYGGNYLFYSHRFLFPNPALPEKIPTDKSAESKSRKINCGLCKDIYCPFRRPVYYAGYGLANQKFTRL